MHQYSASLMSIDIYKRRYISLEIRQDMAKHSKLHLQNICLNSDFYTYSIKTFPTKQTAII